MPSKTKSIPLERFLLQSDIMAMSIGLIPYDKIEKKRPIYETLMQIFFIINMVNLNFILIVEIVYVLIAIKNGNNFVEATMNCTYIGFVFVGQIKISSVLYKKPLLIEIMQHLHRLYPKDPVTQSAYRVREYVWRFNLVSLFFVSIHQILVWFFNLYIAVSYLIYDHWLGWRIVPLVLPYHIWVPWQYEGHWSYYLLYASENFAGYTNLSYQLLNDLLLCVIAIQIIMHFEFLAKQLKDYKPVGCYEKDLKFLSECIEYHQSIIHISTLVNDVFGLSLLVNFISSIFVMCFLGFQITIGVQPDTLVMLFMFLFCSMVQILMICNYGQELITKSESIGHAVYEQDWLKTDLRYRKMLVSIIERAQRPTILKATTFVNVSMATMTGIMQTSYKFFALIRTMYSD